MRLRRFVALLVGCPLLAHGGKPIMRRVTSFATRRKPSLVDWAFLSSPFTCTEQGLYVMVLQTMASRPLSASALFCNPKISSVCNPKCHIYTHSLARARSLSLSRALSRSHQCTAARHHTSIPRHTSLSSAFLCCKQQQGQQHTLERQHIKYHGATGCCVRRPTYLNGRALQLTIESGF